MKLEHIKKRILTGKIAGAVALLLITGAGIEESMRIAPRSEAHEMFVSGYINQTNPAVHEDETSRLSRAIVQEAKNLRIPEDATIDGRPIDPQLFLISFIETESTFKKYAVSSANARGYMQLMPQTVAWLDERNGTSTPATKYHDTETNVRMGVVYINYLFEELGNPRLVALAYNAGPGNVRRGFYVERYWQKILRHYRKAAIRKELAMQEYENTVAQCGDECQKPVEL